MAVFLQSKQCASGGGLTGSSVSQCCSDKVSPRRHGRMMVSDERSSGQKVWFILISFCTKAEQREAGTVNSLFSHDI